MTAMLKDKPALFTLNKVQAFAGETRVKAREVSKANFIETIDADGTSRFIKNLVSDHYEIHQPSEILESFQKVADNTQLTINGYMVNPVNGSLMIESTYDNVKFAGEEHDVNVVFYTSHDGKRPTLLTLQSLRHACWNQVPLLFGKDNKSRHMMTEKHYRNALNLTVMEKLLAGVPASIQAYNDTADLLMNKKMSFDKFVEFYVKSYKLDTSTTRGENRVEALQDIYHTAEGQSIIPDNTAWKAFNVISYLNTHNVSNTSFQAENRAFTRANDTIKRMQELVAA